MNKIFALTTLAAASLALAGCEMPESSDSLQNQKQEQLSKAAVQTVGLPAIVNFQEKRILKDILELRDRADLVTYTYTQDMNGKYHKICNSIGYGISTATQFTNPQKIAASYQSGYAILPQADPNGLFSPASADGTWVLCKVPGSDKIAPQYIEPRIFVMTFPLTAD